MCAAKKRRVLLLDGLELRYAVITVFRLEQRQAVVQTLADRTGIQIQRLAELGHGFLLRCGIFVEGFAQIAVLPQQVLVRRLMRALESGNRRNHPQGQQSFSDTTAALLFVRYPGLHQW